MEKIEHKLKLKHKQVITGCWERNSYMVTKLLGRGGTGHVYLVRDTEGRPWAMKISADVAGITHEHRILRFLNHCPDINSLSIVPKVMELDDFRTGGQVYHYIITEYCPGVNLGRHTGGLSLRDTAVIGCQAAEFLNRLHERGFAFGDLKPGNLVYDFKNNLVHIVDFGSVTIKGQCFRQYTPGYGRMSWGAGTRTAEESYDMFALGLLLCALILGRPGGAIKTDLASFISQVLQGIQNYQLRQTIHGILLQKNLETRDVIRNLSLIIEEERSGAWVNAWFVRIVGAASLAAFVLSWAYYYQ